MRRKELLAEARARVKVILHNEGFAPIQARVMFRVRVAVRVRVRVTVRVTVRVRVRVRVRAYPGRGEGYRHNVMCQVGLYCSSSQE